MPRSLPALLLLFLMPAVHAADDAYTTTVEPILRDRCYSCHSGSPFSHTPQAEAVLTNAEGMMTSSDDGPEVVAGDPAGSPLWVRITMKRGDKGCVPPRGDPLTQEQTDAIAAWIKGGALFPPTAIQPKSLPPDPVVLQKLIALGVRWHPIGLDPSGIALEFRHVADGDWKETLGLVRVMARNVRELHLGGKPLTDADLVMLVPHMKRLDNLDLDHTRITDQGLATIASIPGLKWVSLVGTTVTDAGARQLSVLKHLYLLDLRRTHVSAETAASIKADQHDLSVYTGDDPELAKEEWPLVPSYPCYP